LGEVYNQNMKKDAASVDKTQADPAVLLEKIMQAEVKSAEQISGIKKEADRRIAAVQVEAANSRKDAYASGRRARARLIENGIAKANEAAAEKLQFSESESVKIVEKGKRFVSEAVAISLDFVLGKRLKENPHDSENGKN
jgi:hypothetical protein